MIERLLTKEVAEMLHVKISRVLQLLAAGEINGTKLPPNNKYRGTWYIDKASVIDYMSRRKKAGRPKK